MDKPIIINHRLDFVILVHSFKHYLYKWGILMNIHQIIAAHSLWQARALGLI